MAEQESEPGGKHSWLGKRCELAVELDPVIANSSLECCDKLTSVDTAENFDGKKEGVTGGNPARVIGGKASGGNHTVNVRVILQSLIPGMEDTEEADLGAKVAGIAGDLQ